ncbi:rod-binding protein [Kordiimonas sp. SCSIO 12610]|uniref:rod-binding protein n=1 Tax=Kordiimonas sp. SCSIO 12610 TaxID=2829597 RepID=UPI00210A61EF|nr:rod-binding protein [Kordiimonas sp. SCSIO 12610]UTW54186.1 rod-binding protein [Kordiimonas sp. SCSIO 12610]
MTFQSLDISSGASQLFANGNIQSQASKLSAARANIELAKTNGESEKAARAAAEQFEAVFISQFLSPIFETLPTDGPFGGGHAESVYRGFMVEELGKSIAKNGGFGIADTVYKEILRLQTDGDAAIAQPSQSNASVAYQNANKLQEVSNAA